MAGDWIKMRTALAHDPAVIAMALDLGKSEFEIVGMLHHIWSWADSQSQDGHVNRVTDVWLDRFVHCDGFAKSMADARWLIISKEGIEFPNFSKHNGASAKKRAEATERKRISRESMDAKVVTQESQEMRDKSVTREEKRREEKRREKQDQDQKPSAAAQPDWISQMVALGADPKHCKDWMAVRKQKRAPAPTETVIAAMQREAKKANVTLAAAVQICAERGWQGFRADWLANKPMGGAQAFPTKAERIEAANNAVLQEILDEEMAKGHIPRPVIDDAPAFAPEGDFIEGDFFHES